MFLRDLKYEPSGMPEDMPNDMPEEEVFFFLFYLILKVV